MIKTEIITIDNINGLRSLPTCLPTIINCLNVLQKGRLNFYLFNTQSYIFKGIITF